MLYYDYMYSVHNLNYVPFDGIVHNQRQTTIFLTFTLGDQKIVSTRVLLRVSHVIFDHVIHCIVQRSFRR